MRAILDTPWQNRVTFVVQDNHSPAARKCLIHGREGYNVVKQVLEFGTWFQELRGIHQESELYSFLNVLVQGVRVLTEIPIRDPADRWYLPANFYIAFLPPMEANAYASIGANDFHLA